MQISRIAFFYIAVATAWAATPSKRVDIAPVKISFSVTQVPAGPIPPLWQILAATYSKYGRVVPSVVKGLAASPISTSVEANPDTNDVEYLTPVYIGTSDQKFLISFDTGSSDFWVFSDLQNSTQRGKHSSYHLTGKQTNEYFLLYYADGTNVSGLVYTDKVVVGPMTATSLELEAAKTGSPMLFNESADGILGLGPNQTNFCRPNQCHQWLDTVANQLKQNLFAVALKKGAPGTFDFGYIDPKKYTGSLVYTNATKYIFGGVFWEFVIIGYSIGSSNPTPRFVAMVPDTGSSLMLLEPAIVQAYYKQVTGASNISGSYLFPCSATLPSFTIYTANERQENGKNVVPGSYMNFKKFSNGSCYGGIQNTPFGFNVLGDVFLKAQYIVFDRNASRIGLAQQPGIIT